MWQLGHNTSEALCASGSTGYSRLSQCIPATSGGAQASCLLSSSLMLIREARTRYEALAVGSIVMRHGSGDVHHSSEGFTVGSSCSRSEVGSHEGASSQGYHCNPLTRGCVTHTWNLLQHRCRGAVTCMLRQAGRLWGRSPVGPSVFAHCSVKQVKD
jgi:hypothetical protein